MKNMIFVALVSLLSVGCTQLKKMTSAESRPPQQVTQADVTTLEGGPLTGAKEAVFFSGLEVDSLTVEVKKPGENDFRVLNKYEFKSYGTHIQFGPTVVIHPDGKLTIKHTEPAAPAGSYYRVTIYKSASSELY